MGGVSIAPFRFDVTPPLGHSLLGGWIPPAQAIEDALEAIGFVLTGAGAPIVICAVDWAGIMNDAHVAWRTALAEAAGTSPDRVAVQCVHPHNTPFVCPIARDAAAKYPELPAMFDTAFHDDCLARGAAALRQALGRARRVTHVAHGEATVSGVASNRRVARDPAGRVTAMRRSFCTDPVLAAMPNGTIDPTLQTVSFYADDGSRVVACHYYATHPMSFYEDGRVSSDFCGLARKARQAEDPECTHLYFTGCAGDISAGKYNDGSPEARVRLTQRMLRAIRESESALKPERIERVTWATESVLPPPTPSPSAAELEAAIANPDGSLVSRLLPAFRLGWLRRSERGLPFILSRLRVNELSLLHLPGEMFIAYQLRARAMRPGRPVAVAAYGDDGLWYVPTQDEYPAGGYEVSVAFSAAEVDGLMTGAIRRLLA